uniref:PDZ domain-containing protein n=1 Tax=Steinernema glaseri TaxID=37863 RepID=A0A1I7Z343_9BILA
MASGNGASPGTEKVDPVEVQLKEGEEQLGVTTTATLVVTGIIPGTSAEEKLLLGDKISHINDEPVASPEQLAEVVKKFAPALKVTVVRGLTSSEKELPPEREKNVQRREGFNYMLLKIDYVKGCKFGLGIKHHQNKVLVSRVDEGSLSAKALVQGDRIIDINGDPVSDKDVARTLLLKSLQKTHTVDMVVERAVTEEAKRLVSNALLASQMQPPSVALASDVRDIIARHVAQRKKDSVDKKEGIMKRAAGSKSRGAVKIIDGQKDMMIGTDNEGKELKKVRQ